jgi:hydrogenase nickel incorporation protein HypA/HybF
MHELSLCRSIYAIVRRAVPDRQVAVIDLDIGTLRQVIPATLAYCWDLVAERTALDGSKLRVREISATFGCRECAAVTELAGELRLTCADCGSTALEVRTGEEFLLRSVEVRDLADPGLGLLGA